MIPANVEFSSHEGIEAGARAIETTLGYMESGDKKEFMKGAKVALMLLGQAADLRVDALQVRLQQAEQSAQQATSDLKTMAEIIKRWTAD